MLIFHQGVSSTKTKKRNSAYLKISKQNPVSVKKHTWYILNFIEALAGSQMKVKAVLKKFKISYQTLAQYMCQSSTPIHYMYNLHNILYKISYNSISKPCVEKKKDIQWNILEIFHGTSMCQLFLKIYPYFA